MSPCTQSFIYKIVLYSVTVKQGVSFFTLQVQSRARRGEVAGEASAHPPLFYIYKELLRKSVSAPLPPTLSH